MLLTSHNRILTSRIIRFFVAGKKEFLVHENLIVQHSPVFAAMLDAANGMIEATRAEVALEDTQPAIFASFVDFATYGNYSMDYTAEAQSLGRTQSLGSTAPKAAYEQDSLHDDLQLIPTELIAKTPYLRYIQLFIDCGLPDGLYGDPQPWRNFCNTTLTESGFVRDHRIVQVHRELRERCNHHVQVYVFADYYDVPKLRQICLYKVHYCLQRARRSKKGYKLLFETILLAYDNTREGDLLRKLFVQACVADLYNIRQVPGFSDLLERVPGLAMDILQEQPKYWEDREVALSDVDTKFLREKDVPRCERQARKKRHQAAREGQPAMQKRGREDTKQALKSDVKQLEKDGSQSKERPGRHEASSEVRHKEGSKSVLTRAKERLVCVFGFTGKASKGSSSG